MICTYHDLYTQVDDVTGLASLLGVDEGALAGEINTYNAAVAGQAADAFGKTAFPDGVCACVCACVCVCVCVCVCATVHVCVCVCV